MGGIAVSLGGGKILRVNFSLYVRERKKRLHS